MVRVRTKLRNKALSSASLAKSSFLDGVWLMDQHDGPEELEREIELAKPDFREHQ
jgi:hypothetical protein